MSTRNKTEKSKEVTVNIGGIIAILHRHLTSALCTAAYRENRTVEREREWTLFHLVRFWTAVILVAPPSLARALQECREGRSGFLPAVDASDEAFFQKCRDLSTAFFHRVHELFIEELMPEAPASYASPLAGLRGRFAGVGILDGSKLAKVAHRLKILWPIKEAVLPGCVIAYYDLFLGFATRLRVSTDAAASEHKRGVEIIRGMKKSTLVVGDPLYCTIKFFREVAHNDLFGLFRRNRRLKVRKLGPTPGRKKGLNRPKDDLIQIGCGINQPKMTLRRIKIRGFEVFTDVLDPARLSAEEALLLYRVRWQVERLFFDLKEVLNLNRLYSTAPRTVAMQVYTTAIVHAAMRVAQARLAEEAGVLPEELSPQKLFPRLAAASIQRVEAELCFIVIKQENPHARLKEPDWSKHLPSSRAPLSAILVERRNKKRRKRSFDARRKKWTTFRKIKGGQKLS